VNYLPLDSVFAKVRRIAGHMPLPLQNEVITTKAQQGERRHQQLERGLPYDRALSAAGSNPMLLYPPVRFDV
jgi:hypothetical protein